MLSKLKKISVLEFCQEDLFKIIPRILSKNKKIENYKKTRPRVYFMRLSEMRNIQYNKAMHKSMTKSYLAAE